MQLEARAKINWSLDITGVREDGYHLMDMLIQPVSLSDTITLLPAEDLTLRTEGFPRLKADERHLAMRAARLLKEHTAYPAGASLTVFKRTPVGAGMGGGSADAAAVLYGLNQLWGTGLSLLPARRSGTRPVHWGADEQSALRQILFSGHRSALPRSFDPGGFSGLERGFLSTPSGYGCSRCGAGRRRSDSPAAEPGQRPSAGLRPSSSRHRSGHPPSEGVRSGARPDDGQRQRGLWDFSNPSQSSGRLFSPFRRLVLRLPCPYLR